MPVSPTPDESYYWEIASAYKDAELEILGQIRDRLDKGQSLSDQAWQTARLAEIQTMRREATKVLAGVNQSMASKISGAFGNAYKDGELSALKDTAAFMPEKPSAVSSAARRASVAAIARETTSKTLKTMPGILRAMEDDYRAVVKSSVARVAAGGVDRRAATSKALQQAFGMGLKTGPGSKMNLPDYMTMALRTGTARAVIEGHLDTLEENGVDLVMIHPGPRHCERCDAWANRPLYRIAGKKGVHLFDSATSLKKVKVEVFGTLNEARTAGWGHPNCRCNVGAFIPGASVAPIPRPPFDEVGYEAQQKQRIHERQIREWKIREQLATDPGEQKAARVKIALWQAGLRTLLDMHPDLKRQPHRESTKGTLGPKYNGPVGPPPKAPSTPKPPKTSPKAIDPEPLIPTPIQEWVQGMLKNNPELPAGPIGKLLNPDATAQVKAVALNDLYKNNWITKAQHSDALDALDGVKPTPKVIPPETPTKPAPIKTKKVGDDDGSGVTWEEIDDYGLPAMDLKDAGLSAGKIEMYLSKIATPKSEIWALMDDYDLDGVIQELKAQTGAITPAAYKAWTLDKTGYTPSGVLKPEQKYVDQLLDALKAKGMTPAELQKLADANPNPLSKLNAQTAIAEYEKWLKAQVGDTPAKPAKAPPVTQEYLGPPRYTWDGKSKPKAPAEPALPKTDKALKLDAWLQKVKDKYAAFAKATNNPKKSLESSNNWNYVQQAVAGDTKAIQYLHQNKYLDDDLRKEALDAIADTKKLDPKIEKAYKDAMAQYGQDLAQYKLDLAKYRADNGIVSEAKGHAGATRHNTDQAGIDWAYKNLNSPKRETVGGKAITRYTGSAYASWNAALRGVKPPDLPSGTYKNATKQLDDAMTPMPEDVIVHRGTTFHEFLSLGDLLPPPPPQSLIGKAYTNDGYASTSVGTKAAFHFKPVQLEILVPQGHRAVNAMPVSQFGNSEREVLLSRGTTYFVHDIFEHDNGTGGKWKVIVEIVPDGEDATLWTPLPKGGR